MSNQVPYEEVPGNSLRSQANYERALIKAGDTLYHFESVVDGLDSDEIEVTGVTIKLPDEPGGDYLIVARGYVGGKPHVAFTGGTSLVEAMMSLVNRLRNRSMKWKVDRYAE